MTLTPPRFHIADDMPMSLGKAIALEIGPKPDPLREFEKGRFEIEEDFWRNLKAAKPFPKSPAPSIKDLEQAVFEEWLSAVCPSGDVDSVQAQWLESAAYEDFCADHKPSPPAAQADAGPAKFKVGDRVRSALFADSVHWQGLVVDVVYTATQIGCVSGVGDQGCFGVEDLELIPEPKPTEAPKDGEWVEWKGGEPPVEIRKIEVRFRDGSLNYGRAGDYFAECWTHRGSRPAAIQIVAYRVVK